MEADEEGYYIRGDYVGKLGVERSYEKYLRGEKGVEILLRDAHGRIQGRYMDGEYDRPSIPGKNLTLSLDIDLQILGERLLKNKIGSIVAIEPETGEILCLVSSPNYDPHLMIGRQRGKNHLMLQRDKQKPLLNRALMGVYPPGQLSRLGTGTDLPARRNHYRAKSFFPLFSWFPLWASDSGMSCSRLTFAIDSGYCDFLQLLFLLGAVPYVRRSQVRFTAECHHSLERSHGFSGIRL